MIRVPGMIVPAITPNDWKRLDAFSPRRATSVVPQNTIIITANIYRPLFASDGFRAKAKVEAMKASTVGNHTRLLDHSQKMAMKPDVSPKASFTQANTPPPLGQPVASSALAIVNGIRNVIVPMTYQPMDDQPYSAIDG